MTTITLNLSPELEHQIRTEASRQGVEPDRYSQLKWKGHIATRSTLWQFANDN